MATIFTTIFIMKWMIFVIIFTLYFVDLSNQQQWDTSEITAYQFHIYFFQQNDDFVTEALTLRWVLIRFNLTATKNKVLLPFHSESIQELSETFLAGCRLNRINYNPISTNIIGSFETCCNASAIVQAQSFFMKNHGNLSVLLHPLTRNEILDYTTRAMWLGKDMPLDISLLREDIGPGYDNQDKCLPMNFTDGGAELIGTNVFNYMAFVFALYLCVTYKLSWFLFE